MTQLLVKYFTILSIALVVTIGGRAEDARADVCISDQDTVDIITLLDSSERDITVLGSCEKLVNDLYTQLDNRDKKLVTITTDLIGAKQEVIKYKHSSERWRRVAVYSSLTGALLILIQIAPVL